MSFRRRRETAARPKRREGGRKDGGRTGYTALAQRNGGREEAGTADCLVNVGSRRREKKASTVHSQYNYHNKLTVLTKIKIKL